VTAKPAFFSLAISSVLGLSAAQSVASEVSVIQGSVDASPLV
jgi:hypothetical protein